MLIFDVSLETIKSMLYLAIVMTSLRCTPVFFLGKSLFMYVPLMTIKMIDGYEPYTLSFVTRDVTNKRPLVL